MDDRSFESVLSSRRMCRDFEDEPLPQENVDSVLAAALRGPAAGNTAAIELLVLRGESIVEYWATTLSPERRERFPWPGLFNAPLLVVPYVDPGSYVRRYGEPDKAHTGLGSAEDDWTVPYWWVDGGAAVMAMLLAAEALELGALFFGQFAHEPKVRSTFGVPDHLRALGTVAFGFRASGSGRRSLSAARGRPAVGDIVHEDRWGSR